MAAEVMIDNELRQLEEASLVQYLPGYIINHFKDDFNENVLNTLIKNLDQMIQSVQANNSFKILTLNESNLKLGSRNDSVAGVAECSLSSSLSETTMSACKSLLIEISNRLLEIFTRYHDDLFRHVKRFEMYHEKYAKYFEADTRVGCFTSRSDLLTYQRSILTERLSSRHYNLLSVLFRNVFDLYQQQNCSDEDDENADEEINNDDEEVDEDEENNGQSGRQVLNKDFLIEKFHKINMIL
jgi:hypothetical protein